MKLSTKIAIAGIVFHSIILTIAILLGFFLPESWLAMRILFIFYFPIIFTLNLLRYYPSGISAILCFAFGGMVMYGVIFWIAGVLIDKKLKTDHQK